MLTSVRDLPLPQSLLALHGRWYHGTVAASVLFGVIFAWPWMVAGRTDPWAWIVAAAWVVGAGGLFKGMAWWLVTWARRREYRLWQSWCQGPVTATLVARVYQQRTTRVLLDQAMEQDRQALARGGLPFPHTWLRPHDSPPVSSDVMAGEVRALQRTLQRMGQPCGTWNMGTRAARLARQRQAEAVSERWYRRFGRNAS